MDDVAERSEKSLYLGESSRHQINGLSSREQSPGAGRSSATFPAKEESHFSAGHG